MCARAGYLDERRTLRVSSGEPIAQRIILSGLTSSSDAQSLEPGSSAPDQRSEHDRKWSRSPWLWTGIALVAAGVTSALLLTLRSEPREKMSPAITTRNTPTGGVLSGLESAR